MFNKSAIFRNAWATYRVHLQMGWATTFGKCLKAAWDGEKQAIEARKPAEVKEAERKAAWQEKQDSKARAAAALNETDKARLESLKKELFILECKDLWNDSDRAYSRKLQAQIDALETENANNATNATNANNATAKAA